MEFVGGGDMFEYVVKKNGLREEEARCDMGGDGTRLTCKTCSVSLPKGEGEV